MSKETEQLLNLITKNKNIQKNDSEIFTEFEKFYYHMNEYSKTRYSFESLISDEKLRMKYLTKATNTIIKSKNMPEEISIFASEMLTKILKYFNSESLLEDLEIPKVIKDKMFINENETKRELLIPDYDNIEFLLTLITQNKIIYEEEFEDADLSQTISTGLHSNITEVLSIDRKDLSHLLGTNNDAYSLYEFYRKNYINNEILKILNKIKNTKDNKKAKFQTLFEQKFGIPYNKENYQLLISLRYSQIENMQKEGTITKEQAESLMRSYDEAPKSKTIDFYTNPETIKLLSQECQENANFIYDYVRNNILTNIMKNPQKKKELLEKLAKEFLDKLELQRKNGISNINNNAYLSENDKKIKIKELNNKLTSLKEQIIEKYQTTYINPLMDNKRDTNSPIIRNIIDDYFQAFGNNLKNDSKFQEQFKNKFGYNYPLIDYYEILIKNISFYNFSLMKNLSSIIVDFDDKKKATNSSEKPDVYLVSYSKKKRLKNELVASKEILSSDLKLEQEAFDSSSKTTNEFINSLKSLLQFPKEIRYYFKFDFTSSLKQKKDDNIILETTNPNEMFSLMGFFTPEEERNKISQLQVPIKKELKHKHLFRTNITSNFHKYITYYTRYGVEYPITSVSSIKHGKNKILKISKPDSEELHNYIEIFNERSLNKEFGMNFEYDLYLMNRILDIITNYQKYLKLKKKLLTYQQNKQIFNNEYQEELLSEELNIYYNLVKKQFNEYKDLLMSQIKEPKKLKNK